MKIPVRNLYYLFSYAWDRLEEAELVTVGEEESPSVPDMLARVLVAGVDHVLRRGLDRGYLAHHEALPGVRGRILFTESIAKNSFINARAVCEFDELSYDVLHNRILKATLVQLLHNPELATATRRDVAGVLRKLGEIGSVRVTSRALASIQLHANNSFYGFLLDICRFLHEQSLPTSQGEGAMRFWGVESDEGMWRVFQGFVERFYAREQREFVVRRHRMKWAPARGTVEALDLLPDLETDISLVSDERFIVIDTKFYRRTLQENFGRERFHSAHLYQLLSYLHNLRASNSKTPLIQGVLLYPKTDVDLDHVVEIHGFPVRVMTVDLGVDWREIEQQMLSLLHPWADGFKAIYPQADYARPLLVAESPPPYTAGP